MKWIKTQAGNIIRVGAVSEFIKTENGIDVVIGEKTENICVYDNKEQLKESYEDLKCFLVDNEDMLEFSNNDDRSYLKKYDIEELRISCRSYEEKLRIFMEEHKVIIGGIMTNNEAINNGWIPVSESLPEPDICTMKEVSKSVLVCLKDKDDDTIFICTGYYGYFPDRAPENKGWWCYYDDDKGKKIESEVLAWMPLPELYKAESEDKE